MGVLRKTLAITGWTALGTSGAFIAWTRKNRIVDVPPTDHLFNTTLYARYNPNDCPITQDLCLRKVALDRIKPELLEHEGKLAEAFCAGVWGGLGYAYQRRFLEKKYRSDPGTADQLWDTTALLASAYPVGTKITDHFEVVAKTGEAVVVRCGDSPRVSPGLPRASDGLFEMSAVVNREAGVVEFGLKSLFYDGCCGRGEGVEGKVTAQAPTPPMSAFIQWLHKQYDKVLMETAITNCTR